MYTGERFQFARKARESEHLRVSNNLPLCVLQETLLGFYLALLLCDRAAAMELPSSSTRLNSASLGVAPAGVLTRCWLLLPLGVAAEPRRGVEDDAAAAPDVEEKRFASSMELASAFMLRVTLTAVAADLR